MVAWFPFTIAESIPKNKVATLMELTSSVHVYFVTFIKNNRVVMVDIVKIVYSKSI